MHIVSTDPPRSIHMNPRILRKTLVSAIAGATLSSPVLAQNVLEEVVVKDSVPIERHARRTKSSPVVLFENPIIFSESQSILWRSGVLCLLVSCFLPSSEKSEKSVWFDQLLLLQLRRHR